jgi:uncharacterized RDD family membrane protein YckC
LILQRRFCYLNLLLFLYGIFTLKLVQGNLSLTLKMNIMAFEDQILDSTHEGARRRPMRYGDFLKRFVAALIDGIILAIPTGILSVVMLGSVFALNNNLETMGEENVGAMMGAMGGFYFLLIAMQWLYHALMESSSHQGTVGKKVMNLKVTDMHGNRISFGRATGRHFAKMLSGCTLIGYLMAAFTEKKQALHDIVASTLVLDGSPQHGMGNDALDSFDRQN